MDYLLPNIGDLRYHFGDRWLTNIILCSAQKSVQRLQEIYSSALQPGTGIAYACYTVSLT
jgi:hypothetical protein